MGLLIGELFIHEIKNQGFFINPLWAPNTLMRVEKRSCLWDFMLFLFFYNTGHSLEDTIEKDKKSLINHLE